MKNNSLKRAFSALAIAAVAASASSMAAFADETNGFSQDQIDASAIKPTVFISVDGSDGGKVFDTSIAGQEVECSLNVKGAEDKYASTGFHVFVKGLEIVDDGGDPFVEGGDATKKLAKDVPVYDKTREGYDGFFAATAGSKDLGKDGEMFTFKVKVPATAKAGDVFPIDIMYKVSYNDEGKVNAEDLFCSCDDTDASKLMQAYTFTKGIYNSTTNNTFAAAAADVEKCPALADIDKSVDAYIAIAGADTTTTTTTTEVTTTTTTTTTEATTTSSASTTSGSTTTGSSTTAKAGTGATKNPQTGVSGTGAGLAVAGLAVAVATAFVLRKKED